MEEDVAFVFVDRDKHVSVFTLDSVEGIEVAELRSKVHGKITDGCSVFDEKAEPIFYWREVFAKTGKLIFDSEHCNLLPSFPQTTIVSFEI